MIRGRYPEINGWGSYAELRRRLSGSGIPKRTIESFVRLVKDSKYNSQNGIYRSSTEYWYNTEPRLRQIAKHIGIVYIAEKEKEEHRAIFYWGATNKFGEDLLEEISHVKIRQQLLPRYASRSKK